MFGYRYTASCARDEKINQTAEILGGGVDDGICGVVADKLFTLCLLFASLHTIIVTANNCHT